METLSQITFALNRMMDINHHRVNHYKSLADKAKEVPLKLFYMQYAIQAQSFTTTLSRWRSAYGIPSHTARKGNMLAAVADKLRRTFSSRNGMKDLQECEQMESDALKTYKTALSLSFLPSATIDDISKQTSELEKVHATMKSLCLRMNLNNGKSSSFNISLQY